jgi:hypothetical protein
MGGLPNQFSSFELGSKINQAEYISCLLFINKSPHQTSQNQPEDGSGVLLTTITIVGTAQSGEDWMRCGVYYAFD